MAIVMFGTVRKIVFLLLVVAPIRTGFTQTSSEPGDIILLKNLYVLAVAELQIRLSQDSPLDSISHNLLSDADSIAERNEWQEAYALVTTALDLLSVENHETQAASQEILEKSKVYDESHSGRRVPTMQFETGLDFSQQEFETSYLEGDSVILEQLRSPFIAFSSRHPGWRDGFFQQRLRLDDQFYQYTIGAGFDNGRITGQRSVAVEGGYFYSPHEDQPGFLDSRAMFTLSGGKFPDKRWRVEMDTRYKLYPDGDSLRGNILNTGAILVLEQALPAAGNLFLNIWPRYYREYRTNGYRYWELRSQVGWRQFRLLRPQREVSVSLVLHTFSSDFLLQDDWNSYWEIAPVVQQSWQLLPGIGLRIGGELQWRNYRYSDQITPNFLLQNVSVSPEFYLGDFTTVGIGVFEEGRRHRAADAEDVFSEQADYQSLGGFVSFDWAGINGSLFSFRYQLSNQQFPNAITSIFDTFYSDRLVHSISAFGWLTVTEKWRLQLLVNYDNDQDQLYKQSDIRSTFFSGGIVYQY